MQISSALRLCINSGQTSQQICWSNQSFLFSLGHARFLFLVKKNFLAAEKIKFIFFLSILKQISSLKPAGEDENEAHVNKL
jgi:hypothetical protein